MKQKKQKQLCKRCGKCCVDLYLPFSPSELKNSYDAWANNKESIVQHKEIYLIYPMLKYLHKKGDQYYYRCKHLEYLKDGTAKCSIYDHRPKMCSEFPFYNPSTELRIGMRAKVHVKLVEDCGYRDKYE
jgi:Fe-S-cluster containining protein